MCASSPHEYKGFRMAKYVVLAILLVLCFSLMIVHNYPIASDPYRGVPDAYQLLRDNPDTQTIQMPVSTLNDVLRDFHRDQGLYRNAVKKAAIFNFIAIILCFVIYRMLNMKKRIEVAQE